MKRFYISLFFIIVFISICLSQVRPGAERMEDYLSFLKGKSVALVANQCSMVADAHLLDTLLSRGIDVKKVFTPEHGFRGSADAGEKVIDDKDKKTGISIVSLYGKHKKPSVQDLQDVDLVLFDIQDVGLRFYTYISTLHYIMESCAENNVEIILLDRPNPNAFYIDGPVLEEEYKSFVGMHKVPIVYGMTIGEYALMIKGENWINKASSCQLKVIALENWTHNTRYILPIKPSPNLPNEQSILLYPSLCFFEGTIVSAGRGTDFPFQVFGMPSMRNTKFTFTPHSMIGAKNPKFKDIECNGVDLRDKGYEQRNTKQINLEYLIFAYNNVPKKNEFFNSFFEKLAGTSNLRKQIEMGISKNDIRLTWLKGIDDFKIIRAKYLLYK